MTSKPKISGNESQKELDKVEKQFDDFEKNIKELTLDKMNAAPKQETEPLSISQKDIENSKDVYLKPSISLPSREKFNEKFREKYNFEKEYVRFIAQNNEIIGEVIEIWTKPFPGIPCEFWKIPTGTAIWAPRYVAERLTKCQYHRLVMKQNVSTGSDGMGQYYGAMAADTTIQRLDAIPVSARKSIFMGTGGF